MARVHLAAQDDSCEELVAAIDPKLPMKVNERSSQTCGNCLSDRCTRSLYKNPGACLECARQICGPLICNAQEQQGHCVPEPASAANSSIPAQEDRMRQAPDGGDGALVPPHINEDDVWWYPGDRG